MLSTGSCYWEETTRKTWDDANADCRSKGGILAVMSKPEQMSAIDGALSLGWADITFLYWNHHGMHIYVNTNRMYINATKDLLMTVYKAYFQSKFDYGISVWGCTTQSNIDKIQRMQNRVARIITGCYDFINTRGLDLVNELNLQNIRERRNYFLCNHMFKSIYGLAPTYLSDNIVMNADINEYNTRGAQNRNVY